MDDFRRPYEFNEEKRGIILLYIILLLSVETFMAFSYLVQVTRIYSGSAFSYGFMAIGVLYIAFLLFTVIICYKLKYYMVTVSKIYLMVRAIYMVFCITIIYVNASKNESLIANGPRGFKSTGELMFTVLIGPLSYVLIFSVIWYLYFTKSQRCKEISKKGTSE